MNRSTLWLAFSAVFTIGVGFLGGAMYRRRPTPTTTAIGRLYEIDGDTFIDGALVDFLTPRADSRETLSSGDWLLLRYRTATLFVHRLHDREVLPRQRGALYAVRNSHHASSEWLNDHQVRQFLQDMIDLGLVEFVGRWQSWRDVLPHPGEETRT